MPNLLVLEQINLNTVKHLDKKQTQPTTMSIKTLEGSISCGCDVIQPFHTLFFKSAGSSSWFDEYVQNIVCKFFRPQINAKIS